MTKTVNKGKFQNTNNSSTTNTGPVYSNTNNVNKNKHKNDYGGIMSGGTVNFTGNTALQGSDTAGGSSEGGQAPQADASNGYTVVGHGASASASAAGGGGADSMGQHPSPLGTTTIQQSQLEGPSVEVIRNQEFIEVPNLEAEFEQSPVDRDYDVDSIKTWLSREHRIAQIPFTNIHALAIDRELVKRISKGKLDFFRYFRCDFVITLRWNVPKTTYGAFVLYMMYSDAGVLGVLPGNAGDASMAYVKVFSDLQASSVTLEVPFFYPYSYFDLASADFAMGVLNMYTFGGMQSISNVIPDFSMRMYCRCKNITIMTPYPRSLMPQGPVLGIIGLALGVAETASSVAANVSSVVADAKGSQQPAETPKDDETTPAPMYQPSGFSAIRNVPEAINLVRQDGFDPAQPMSRVVQPFKGKRDDFAITDYEQLISIPSYEVMRADQGYYNTRFACYNHDWLYHSVQPYTFTRANFHCRLRCIATPFHSGRLRIIYMPDPDDELVLTSDNVAHGLSLVWDVQENATFDFEIPYGNASEFNIFPGFALVQENEWAVSFGTVSTPTLILEWWASDLMIMGYNPVHDIKSQPAFNITSRDIVYAPILEAQGMEECGFYHDLHTADDEKNTSLVTSARRLGEVFSFQPSDGAVLPLYEGIYALTPILKSIENPRCTSFVNKILANSAGFRGSFKVVIQCTKRAETTSWHVVGQYGVSTYALQPPQILPAEFVPNDSDIVEFAMPYYSHQNFYTGTYGDGTSASSQSSLDGPQFYIESSVQSSDPEPSPTFRMWIGAFDDFQILMPSHYDGYPVRSDRPARNTKIRPGPVSGGISPPGGSVQPMRVRTEFKVTPLKPSVPQGAIVDQEINESVAS